MDEFPEFGLANKPFNVDGNQVGFFTKVQQTSPHSNSLKQNRSKKDSLVENSPSCYFGSLQSIDEFTEFNNGNKLSNEVNANQVGVFTKDQETSTHSNSGKKNRSRYNSLVGNSPTCLQNLSDYFLEYCRFTGIHGIKYVGARGRFIIEKLLWSIVLTILCSLCLYLISKTYSRWVTSPVVVTFATAEVPISKIPFPAVTICPETKTDSRIFSYSDVFWKKIFKNDTTAEEERNFENLRVVCNDDIYSSLTGKNGSLLIDQSELLTLLSAAFSPSSHLNLTNTKWLLKELKWVDAFSVTLTSAGFCYSFNALRQDEIFKNVNITDKSANSSKPRKWSLERDYPDDDSDSFPRRTSMSGISGGLNVIGLFVNGSNLDYMCSNYLSGFKVVLHHSSEMPDMDKHFQVPLDKIVTVAITPRMTRMSEELKSYRPEDRKCYLADEKSLKFFKIYTQQNCIQDCLFNYTLLKCGCLPFYIPHDNNTATCGIGSKGCMEEIKLKYFLKERETCNCLPSCISLEYNIEVSQSEWDWQEYLQMFKFGDKNPSYNDLVVFYKELQFLPSERNELFGYVDFFSNVGGLLGLFVGFSVTTFIEIVYFLSLRLVCNIKKFGRKFWSGNPELIDDNYLSRRKIV